MLLMLFKLILMMVRNTCLKLKGQHFYILFFSTIIEKNNDKFQCPKCESKLKTSTTLKRHIKKHNGGFKCISKKKRQYSELERMDDEYPSINLNHHILENEINLQVDTSNTFNVASRQR